MTYNTYMKKVKLTPAQAYALQVKADRRAAAAERRGQTVAQDNARVKAIYKKAEIVQKTAESGRISVKEAPAEIQALVAKIAPAWKAQVGFDFPETVYYGPGDWDISQGTHTFRYWVDGRALNSLLPAMARMGGKPCGKDLTAKPGQYRFRTASLRTVESRLRRDLPVFA
jgi:hypothetical protein